MMQGNYLNENQRSGEQSTAVVDFITAFRQMNEAEQAQRMNTLLSDVDDFSRIIQNKRDFLSLCRELPELYVDACIRTITHTPSFFNLLVKRPEDFIFLRHSAEIGGRFIQAVVGNEAFFETLLNQYGEHSRIIFLRVEVLEGNLSRAMHDFIIRLEQETEQERANRIESVLTDRDYFYHIVKSEADFFQLCQILPETDFERLLQGILADPLFFRIIIKSQYSFSNFITQPDRGERIREVILGNDVVFYDCVDRYFSQDEKGEREFCRRFLSYVDVIMKYVERYNENKEAFKRCIEIYFFELQFMFSPDDFRRLKEDVLENEGFGQYLYNMIFSQENFNDFFSYPSVSELVTALIFKREDYFDLIFHSHFDFLLLIETLLVHDEAFIHRRRVENFEDPEAFLLPFSSEECAECIDQLVKRILSDPERFTSILSVDVAHLLLDYNIEYGAPIAKIVLKNIKKGTYHPPRRFRDVFGEFCKKHEQKFIDMATEDKEFFQFIFSGEDGVVVSKRLFCNTVEEQHYFLIRILQDYALFFYCYQGDFKKLRAHFFENQDGNLCWPHFLRDRMAEIVNNEDLFRSIFTCERLKTLDPDFPKYDEIVRTAAKCYNVSRWSARWIWIRHGRKIILGGLILSGIGLISSFATGFGLPIPFVSAAMIKPLMLKCQGFGGATIASSLISAVFAIPSALFYIKARFFSSLTFVEKAAEDFYPRKRSISEIATVELEPDSEERIPLVYSQDPEIGNVSVGFYSSSNYARRRSPTPVIEMDNTESTLSNNL